MSSLLKERFYSILNLKNTGNKRYKNNSLSTTASDDD